MIRFATFKEYQAHLMSHPETLERFTHSPGWIAAQAGVSRAAVYKWIRKGHITVVVIHRRATLLDPKEVEQYLRTRK